MKKSSKSISLVLAAGITGVAFFALARAQFTAALPVTTLLAIAAALAVGGIAMTDYSRRLRPLTKRAPILRPARPNRTTPPAKTSRNHLAA